jgi:hypothetical protein
MKCEVCAVVGRICPAKNIKNASVTPACHRLWVGDGDTRFISLFGESRSHGDREVDLSELVGRLKPG